MGGAAWGVALAGWVLVGMAPGFLLATAVQPTTPALARGASAPLLSIGIAFACATWVDLLHRGAGLAAAAVGLALTSLGSLIVIGRRDRFRSLRPGAWTGVRVGLLGVVTASLVVSLAVVATSAAGWGAVVPYDDGISHGIFTARMMLSGSVDPLEATATDVVSGTGGVFYPLGLHLVAAILGWVVGPELAITSAGIVAVSVWAPLAIAAWGRRVLDPTTAVVAAALVALASPWFPTAQLQWGGWTLVAAIALVPAAALALLDVADRRGLLLAAVAMGGILALHVTEALVVLLLVAATWWLDRSLRADGLRKGLRALVALAAGALVLVPLLPSLLTRTSRAPASVFGFSLNDALTELVIHPVIGVSLPGPLTVVTASVVVVWWSLAVLGSRLQWTTPAARGSVATFGLFVALSLLAFWGVAPLLTRPWYSNGYRLLAQAVALACLPMAVVLVRAARRRGTLRVVALTSCLAAVAVLAATNVRTAVTAWESSVVAADDRAVFAWLAEHVKPGERVLNDARDGTGWVYAATDGAVAPVFGVHPDGWRADPAWESRWYLHDHVADAQDARVAALLDEWDVRYVVVGTGLLPQRGPRLALSELRASQRLREVVCSGIACVFEATR